MTVTTISSSSSSPSSSPSSSFPTRCMARGAVASIVRAASTPDHHQRKTHHARRARTGSSGHRREPFAHGPRRAPQAAACTAVRISAGPIHCSSGQCSSRSTMAGSELLRQPGTSADPDAVKGVVRRWMHVKQRRWLCSSNRSGDGCCSQSGHDTQLRICVRHGVGGELLLLLLLLLMMMMMQQWHCW